MSPFELIGTWNLMKHGFEAIDGVFSPTAEMMTGQLIYAADGGMSVLITKRKDPVEVKDLVVYAGKFSVNGERVLHHIRVSPSSKRENTTEVRLACLDGNTLRLSTEPTAEGRFIIAWERVRE